MALDQSLFESRRFVQVHIDLVAEVGIAKAYLLSLIHFRSLGRKEVTETPDGHGWWRCGVPELAEMTGYSERGIKTVLSELEDAGYLLREQHQVGGIFDRTNSYRVAISAPSMGQTSPHPMGQTSPPVPSSSDTEEHTATDLLVDLDAPLQERSDPFEEWWSIWPKKVARSDAERAFKKAIKKIPLPALLASTHTWVNATNDMEKRFLPNPATWLNGERWLEASTQQALRIERQRANGQASPHAPRPQRFDRPQDDDVLGAPAKGWDL